ncbi:unnamed protein product [Mycena citricolor]|uniref:Uncharacterized protein n=1 Tax=Mycena citricolor TaxID=2018698 RepID=A0AAD2HQ83_9AGAR|nr:unnamed protein product [Mycena citricolor]
MTSLEPLEDDDAPDALQLRTFEDLAPRGLLLARDPRARHRVHCPRCACEGGCCVFYRRLDQIPLERVTLRASPPPSLPDARQQRSRPAPPSG